MAQMARMQPLRGGIFGLKPYIREISVIRG